MSEFALGQRWISDSESDLGLGTVVALNGRRISMLFPASGDQREYVIGSAPLTRVSFNPGDNVESAEGWSLAVKQVINEDGLNIYLGIRSDNNEPEQLIETRINHHLKFNKPQDRLFTAQIDRNDWYTLRYEARKLQYEYQTHPLVGLAGARTALIPHQLHIAKEAGSRVAPRVLLSDEVGLGKTIEAGMIIHQQLLTGRASRILILLPESLQYQWLVEMLRRFNLQFAIFNEERCGEYDSSEENPFETEQLIIAPVGLLADSDKRLEQASQAQWDLVVVDEAHHLDWHPDGASPAYLAVEKLSRICAGLLLLTATPDQLGHQSHFARLRLLDPERFYDYDKFVAEEAGYSQIAEQAKQITSNQDLSEVQIAELKKLIDQHGTGRVLFRNTRASVKGFPVRCVLPVEMELPSEYQAAADWWLNRHPDDASAKTVAPLLTPEFLYESAISGDIEWWKVDPRVEYLAELIKENKHEKFLIICARASTALTLEQAVRVKFGLNAAVFHEGMSIVERDRAAAWFADQDEGCQLLICSEIGSEGRNFQFAHHLILFDLPLNPDLLEQRIGRLDRIGQSEDIKIHVPYFENTAQEVLFRWYHDALEAFEHTLTTGQLLYSEYKDELLEFVASHNTDEEELDPLLESVNKQNQALKQKMEQGRDRLLELHSKGQGRSEQLVSDIEALDNQTALPMFMIKVFDIFGISQEDRGENSIVLKPTEHMLTPSFPCLRDEGLTVTFDRDTALAQEDVHFLSWDHPMVQGAMELIIDDDLGTTSVALLKNKQLPAGSFFVELVYLAETSAPKALQMGRFLPTTPVRLLLDKNGNDLAANVAFDTFNQQLNAVGKQTASKLASALQSSVHPMIETANKLAQSQLDTLKKSAKESVNTNLDDELARLKSLKQLNPNVREDELFYLEKQKSQLLEHVEKAELKLDAIRLIVVSH